MTDKKTRIVSNLLSLMLGAGIGAGCYRVIERILHVGDQRIELEAPSEEVGGVIISETESQGVKVSSARIAREDYAKYAVPAAVESAYTLKITVLPEDADNKLLNYDVRFANPNSGWASGKRVSDYVSVQYMVMEYDEDYGGELAKWKDISTSGGDAYELKVTCKAGFGEAIEIAVSSREDATKSSVCRCDYVKRLESLDVSVTRGGAKVESITLGDNATYTVSGTPTYTVGTIEGTTTFKYELVYNAWVDNGSAYEGSIKAYEFDKTFIGTSNLYENLLTRKSSVSEFRQVVNYIHNLTMSGGKVFAISVSCETTYAEEQISKVTKGVSIDADISLLKVSVTDVSGDHSDFVF